MTSTPQHLVTLFCILALSLFALAVTSDEWFGAIPETVQAGE